jgi:uncharacterized protein (TIGR02099 family)
MQNTNSTDTGGQLARRWHRARAAYRFANRASHHLLGFTVKLALVAYFLFAILFLALRYAVLPHIDVYKGDIERLASHAVGNQVSIDRIYASWHGLHPSLFLGDVRLRDKAGRQVLSLPSVSATLSWWSVLALDVRFASLEVIRPDLDILREPSGKLYVAGIPLENSKADGKGFDWLLGQREVAVREGRLRWTDQLRGAPELALENVNLLLRNGWNTHQMALQATPPTALSQPLDVRADFSHPRWGARPSNIALWKGELYADVRATDLAGWKAYIDYPVDVVSGTGSVRAWLSLDSAKLAGFTADVSLLNVNANLGRDLPPLDVRRMHGRLSAKEQFPAGVEDGTPTFGSHGHSVTLTDFSLVTSDGLALPPTSMSETFTPPKGGKPGKTEIHAKLLDLATVAELAAQLPLTSEQRQMLADFSPRGQLLDFSAEWTGAYPAVASYRVKGNIAGLGLKAQPARLARAKTATSPAQAATPAIPGFDNLTGSIDATDKGGSIKLDSTKAVLRMPLLAEPDMPFDQLKMAARWSFEKKDQFLFEVDSLNFVQGTMSGSLTGKHLMPLVATPFAPYGTIDLRGSVTGFEINTINRYLPVNTVPHLRDWLVGALESGVGRDVSLVLRGDLSKFPFDKPADKANSEFKVVGRIDNGRLNYTPGMFAKDGKAPLWPQADKINGTIVFDRARLEINADTARTGAVALAKVKAVVPDLLAHEILLDIDGTAAGPLQEFVNYVAASPVLDMIGHFTDETRANGNAKLGLKLHLPLDRLDTTKVAGSLQLLSNDVVLFSDLPPVSAAIGKIEFNERGLTLNGVGGSLLGGPLSLTGGTQKDGSIVVKLGGAVSADGVRKQYASPAVAKVVARLSGSTRYSGQVAVRDKQAVVTIDSTLAGLGADFPHPLKKAAPESMPVHFVLTDIASGDANLLRDKIELTVGTTVAARYLRERKSRGPWLVTRGGIGINTPAPEPDSALALNVNLKHLDVDQWVAIGDSVVGAGAGASSGPDLSQYIMPELMAARATELVVGDRKLDNVVVGASHAKGNWQASIDSRQASGYVTWNDAGAGKITARLSSLIIPEASAADVNELLGANKPTTQIPALDIIADRFELSNKQLGKLDLQASNVAVGQGREWRINKLSLVNPDGELKGSGKWVTQDGRSNTTMNVVLDIDDAGKMLDRFGFPETVRRGKGKLSADIAWNGVPYTLDMPSLSGKVKMEIEAGQFLKQDPGAAKLLGVLSLQVLPRLLKLDFHDVFSEGLAFDGITADAVIARGVVRTDNLKMFGTAATVLMDGTADLANETTNLHVVVIPEFNLGTGPLVYMLAVNPVVGLGSFLAQLFLRAPMMKALTYQMQVTGPFKNPIVTKLDSGKFENKPDIPAKKAEK